MAQGKKRVDVKVLRPPRELPKKPPPPRSPKTKSKLPAQAFSFARIVETSRGGYATFLTGRLKNAVLSCRTIDPSLSAELALARGLLAISVSDYELASTVGGDEYAFDRPSIRTILSIIETITNIETSIAAIRTRFSATPSEIKQTVDDLLRVLSDELSPDQLAALAKKLESIKWPVGVSVGVNPSTAIIPVSNGS